MSGSPVEKEGSGGQCPSSEQAPATGDPAAPHAATDPSEQAPTGHLIGLIEGQRHYIDSYTCPKEYDLYERDILEAVRALLAERDALLQAVKECGILKTENAALRERVAAQQSIGIRATGRAMGRALKDEGLPEALVNRLIARATSVLAEMIAKEELAADLESVVGEPAQRTEGET